MNVRIDEYISMSQSANCFDKVTGDAEKIVTHICNSIANAPVSCTPFEHIEVSSILPRETFMDVLGNWPDESVFSKVEDYSSFDSSDSKKFVGSRSSTLIQDASANLSPSDNDQLDGFWSHLADALRDVRILQCLANKMQQPLEEHLAAVEDMNRSSPGFRMYLCEDEGERAALGPHVDAVRKIITMVLYVSITGQVSRKSPSKWGTALYSMPESDRVAPLDFQELGSYEPEKEVAFQANKAWLFPNNVAALHGVSGGEANVKRRTIMCGYWLFSPQQ